MYNRPSGRFHGAYGGAKCIGRWLKQRKGQHGVRAIDQSPFARRRLLCFSYAVAGFLELLSPAKSVFFSSENSARVTCDRREQFLNATSAQNIQGRIYGVGIIGNRLGPTTSKGPIRKIAAKYFEHTWANRSLCFMTSKHRRFLH